MASGQQSNVANMLGTVLKDLIASSWSTNSDNSSANKKKVVSESFKKNSKKFNKDDDASVKKVVETLEKLVDAKDDALSEEVNRRREAEQKVDELRKQLEKFQVTSDTTEEKDQVKSTMMQLVDVLLEEHSSKNKQWKSNGKRGGGRGRGRGGRGDGPSGSDNNRKGDEHSQPGSAKFNNGNNIKTDKEDHSKVFNKLSFDDLASARKMQNDGKTQFFQQQPEKNMNSNVGPVPNFHQSGGFHGAPVYGLGNQFPHPQQLPNQYYMPPQFGPPNPPFPPPNFPFTPPNFPAPPLFNFPPQQLNVPPQGFGPQMSSDGLTLGGKKLTPQELSDIKQCLKNDKTNVPGHIQHNKTNFKPRAQKQKQNKDKEGEKTPGKEKEGEKDAAKKSEGGNVGKEKGEKTTGKKKQGAGKENEGENVVGKEKEGEKTAGKKKQGAGKVKQVEKTDEENNEGENVVGKEKEGEKTAGKKKQGAGKVKQGEKTGEDKSSEKQDEDKTNKDTQKSQDGSSTGARKKEPKEEKKQGKKKNKNKDASGEGSKAVNPIQLLVRAGIPTEAEIRSKNIDIDLPIKDFMVVGKDGDKPVSEVPSTLKDMISFKQKYPNAQAILIQDQ